MRSRYLIWSLANTLHLLEVTWLNWTFSPQPTFSLLADLGRSAPEGSTSSGSTSKGPTHMLRIVPWLIHSFYHRSAKTSWNPYHPCWGEKHINTLMSKRFAQSWAVEIEPSWKALELTLRSWHYWCWPGLLQRIRWWNTSLFVAHFAMNLLNLKWGHVDSQVKTFFYLKRCISHFSPWNIRDWNISELNVYPFLDFHTPGIGVKSVNLLAGLPSSTFQLRRRSTAAKSF